MTQKTDSLLMHLLLTYNEDEACECNRVRTCSQNVHYVIIIIIMI